MNRRGFFRRLAVAALSAAATHYAPSVLVPPKVVPDHELMEGISEEQARTLFFGNSCVHYVNG